MTKMQVKINRSDLKLLLENVQDFQLLRKLQDINRKGQWLEGGFPTDRYLINVTSIEAESIIDTLSDVIVESGVGDDGELNALGYQIERLIDIFSSE